MEFGNLSQTMRWDHTAALLSMTFNLNRGAKTKPARMEDFHPYRKPKRRGMKARDIAGMRPRIEAMARAMK